MIGPSATVYCCFQLSLCLAGPLSVRRKITVSVFYSTFTNVFIFITFLTFLTFLLFLEERFFHLCMVYSVCCVDDRVVLEHSGHSRLCRSVHRRRLLLLSSSLPVHVSLSTA